MTNKCTNCGKKLNKDAKFCMNCGQQIEYRSVQRTGYSENKEKCPNCGEIMKSFSAFCPACGFEIRGERGISAAKKLMQQIDSVGAKREGFIGGIKSIFGKKNILEQKISIISSFVVPNTREDILEAMILAISNISADAYNMFSKTFKERKRRENERALNVAWKSVYEQALDRARILMLDEEEVERIISMYDEKRKKIMHQKLMILYVMIGIIGVVVLLNLLIYFLASSR